MKRWTSEALIIGYMGKYVYNSLVYASENEMNVTLNDLNAKNKMNIPMALIARSQRNLTTFLDGQTLA